MKVLSVQQPHADLILFGGKWCENRSWKTNYRGELFIHASRMDRSALQAMRSTGVDPVAESPGKCRTGAIIGSVVLEECAPVEDVEDVETMIDKKTKLADVPDRLRELFKLLKRADKHSWQYVAGEWCWILSDPQPIEPIPCKGKLGIWTASVESEVVAV